MDVFNIEWPAREPKKILRPQRKNLSWNTGTRVTSQKIDKRIVELNKYALKKLTHNYYGLSQF